MNLFGKFALSFSPETLRVFGKVTQLAARRRMRAALVGGVVRDLLLGTPIGDADIMLEHPAKPFVQDLSRALHAKLVSHERFFTFVLLLPGGSKMDVVTAREETYPIAGRLPEVSPATIEKDLKRRDFTINAIACWLNKTKLGEALDPFDGMGDLRRKLVRALHSRSFEDDPTRVFRAARFAGRLGFEVESKTESWIRFSISQRRLANLTPVRRRHEFELLMKEKDPLPALRLLKTWGAIGQFHPDWDEIDPAGLDLNLDTDFLGRLARWFKVWDPDQRLRMMSDLSFEKAIKRNVLSKLVQFPSTK